MAQDALHDGRVFDGGDEPQTGADRRKGRKRATKQMALFQRPARRDDTRRNARAIVGTTRGRSSSGA